MQMQLSNMVTIDYLHRNALITLSSKGNPACLILSAMLGISIICSNIFGKAWASRAQNWVVDSRPSQTNDLQNVHFSLFGLGLGQGKEELVSSVSG